MKKSIKKSLQIAIFAILALGISNCDIINPPKKSDDTGLLLLGAFLLNQEAPPTWAVSMTATLKTAAGADLDVVNAVTLTNNAATTSVRNDSTKALVLTNNATNVKVFANPNAQAGKGVFNISFTISSASTPLKFAYTTLAGGGNADTIADYTVAAGESTFTIVTNDADPTNLNQVSGLATTGKRLEVTAIRTVRSGSYNLVNPTVGERLCDGANVGNPVIKTGTISAAETWSGAIRLQGTVFADAPITVTAGTVIFGDRGSSFFIRNANKLTAIGTASNPICWTSSASPGSRQPGDWGGIVTIGDSGTTRSTAGQTEGTTPQNYGGGTADPGTLNLEMEYNIVEFGGNEVAPGDELNSISMYASNTKLTNVQAHRGLDDQFEQWGGRIAWNKLIATGGLDDDFDLDEGTKGTISNAIGHKYPASCGGTASTDPHGLEWDGINSGGVNGFGATNVTLEKFAILGAGITSGQAARLREGAVVTLRNGVFYGFVEGINTRGGNGQQASVSVPTSTNVRMQSTMQNFNADTSTDANTKGAAAEFTNVTRDLTALPIVSDGDISNTCGFSGNKPDYTLTAAASSAQGPSQDVGKFWEGWAVFRGR
jgi:hypothetical protein